MKTTITIAIVAALILVLTNPVVRWTLDLTH